MPGKSRKKGKYTLQNKKQGGQTRPATVDQPSSVDEQPQAARANQTPIISTPQSSPKIVQESPRVAATRPVRSAILTTRASSIRTEFVGKELRSIAILAVLMFILIFVLARVIA